MATNTTATTQNHNGTGSQNNFAISFAFLANTEVDVTVGGVLKTLGTHYNIVGSQVQFTSGNTPPSGTANVVFTRDTDISAKKVDFADGSVLTETDLDNNGNQILFGLQEIADDYVKRDGTQTVTGNLVFEGATDDDNETTLAITDPTADRTITIPDITGTVVTTGDTSTVSNQMIAGDAVTNAKIADNSIDSEHYVDGSIDVEHLADNSVDRASIVNDAVDGNKIADNSINSEHYVDGSIDTAHIANSQITTAKIAADAVDGTKIADDSINSEHYVDRSIDTQHIGASQVTTNELGPDAVTSAKLADNSVNSEHYVDGSIDHVHLANDIIDGDNIQDDVINSEHYVDGSIDHEHLANDIIDSDNIQDNAINSEHYVDGSIDHEHLANDVIDGDNIQDDVINSEHIVAGALDNEHYAAGSITSNKLSDATVITASEQASATTNDTSFLTSAAADARFFNISTGDTIKDGDTFPDNDTTIATTAAINDRIIDLIDDVGGFTIIASEQAFPNVNPQGVTGQAAVLSVKAATTNLVPSGTTVTVVNGNVANNANITITGVPTTIPSGFGFLVESTTTLHTYTFHRLVPKATEVTTVAGKAVEIGRLGTADAVADMAILGTADVVADMNTLATADIVSDMNTLAVADVISDMNTLAVADVISDMDTVATNVTNVNNVGNNVTNINSVSNSAGANQTFTVTVQNVSGNKYFIDGVQTPVLKLARGKTYTFDMSDSSNSGHPLAFRDSSDNSYTTGVTTSGTAGSSGATVVIVVAANAPSSLKYYCTSHGNAMGNTINVIDDNVGAVAGSLTNVNIVGGAITNVNNVGNSISNVNTVASNISSVNSFANTYRIGSSNPTTSLDTGDLFFNTSTNSLKVYTGSAWVDGVTQTGNFALKTGNTFTGSNIHNDNVKSIYGTSSDGLEIFHNASDSIINDQGTGSLKLQTGGNTKIEITNTGTSVTGNIVVSGNVDGRDVAADGTKLDGIEAGATADQTASDIKTLLASNKLGSAHITTNAIGASQLADDAVDTNAIQDDAVTADKLANTSVTAGSYGSATAIPAITVDAQGRITAASTNSVNTTTNLSTSTATGSVTVNSSTGNNATISEATSSAAGVMSTAHHDKLDGIESGATADQTKSDIDALGIAASTAATLATARTIAGVSFNGSANISLNNNAITNGAGYVTASIINSLNASNLSSGTIPDARFPATLPAASGANLTNLPAGNLTGTVADARISTLTASKLTGALPAIDGSNLTGISAGATGGGSDEIFYENGQNVTTDYTITNGKNAMAAGPITIDSGAVVTVGVNETLTIV